MRGGTGTDHSVLHRKAANEWRLKYLYLAALIRLEDCFTTVDHWSCRGPPSEPFKESFNEITKLVSSKMSDADLLKYLNEGTNSSEDFYKKCELWNFLYKNVRHCPIVRDALRFDKTFNQTALEWSHGLYKKFCQSLLQVDASSFHERYSRQNYPHDTLVGSQQQYVGLRGVEIMLITMTATILLYLTYMACCAVKNFRRPGTSVVVDGAEGSTLYSRLRESVETGNENKVVRRQTFRKEV